MPGLDGVEQAQDGGLPASLVDEARDVALDGAGRVPFRLVRETPQPAAVLWDDVSEDPPVGQWIGYNVLDSPMRDE